MREQKHQITWSLPTRYSRLIAAPQLAMRAERAVMRSVGSSSRWPDRVRVRRRSTARGHVTVLTTRPRPARRNPRQWWWPWRRRVPTGVAPGGSTAARAGWSGPRWRHRWRPSASRPEGPRASPRGCPPTPHRGRRASCRGGPRTPLSGLRWRAATWAPLAVTVTSRTTRTPGAATWRSGCARSAGSVRIRARDELQDSAARVRIPGDAALASATTGPPMSGRPACHAMSRGTAWRSQALRGKALRIAEYEFRRSFYRPSGRLCADCHSAQRPVGVAALCARRRSGRIWLQPRAGCGTAACAFTLP